MLLLFIFRCAHHIRGWLCHATDHHGHDGLTVTVVTTDTPSVIASAGIRRIARSVNGSNSSLRWIVS